MDRVIIEEKTESLRLCLQRVQEKTPDNVESLQSDVDLQDILVLNLTRAVQLCVDIGSHLISGSDMPAPTSMGDTFVKLEELKIVSSATRQAMQQAVGFRNLAVDQYEAINWALVWEIATLRVADVNQFCAEVWAHLNGLPDDLE